MPVGAVRDRLIGVGRGGIKRRKRRPAERPRTHELALDDTDTGRLFGQFRWGAYTPAGNLERHGFFWRQVQRNGATGWRAAAAAVLWLGAVVLLGGSVIGAVVLLIQAVT